MFSRFDEIHECDKRTNGQTEYISVALAYTTVIKGQ